MPSTSKKQHNFMEAVAHNPSFAKKAGVPQSVGKDFSNADKGKTFKRGGDMATKKANPFMEMIAKKKDMAGKKKDDMHKMPDGKMMKDSAMKKMASGGMPMKDGKPTFVGDGKGKMASGGMAKKMASGGSASKRADGVAQKGKTKGKMLNKGGMAC